MCVNAMAKETVLALAGTLLLCATPVLASACMDEIGKLERKLADAKSNPADQPTGVQSVDAQLGYPSTAKSMAQAEQRADEAVQAILNRAKTFDAENKASECQSAVAEARLHFGPQ
jgi:hypothetical protein